LYYFSKHLQEIIVDSRFNLLSKNFQDQIDDLKGKVVYRKDSEITKMRNLEEHHEQHEIKKRQTKTSSNPKRPIYFQNRNSPCTFYYPDHPDAVRENDNYSQTTTNQQQPNASKLKRPICENSSSFCTLSNPSHVDDGHEQASHTPTVVNDANNKDNVLDTKEQPESDRNNGISSTPIVTNEMLSKDSNWVKGMPTSCKDLQLLGHKLNGIHLIKTSKPNEGVKIEAVFCDFKSQTELSGTVIQQTSA